MEYKIVRLNEDTHTATVLMSINGKTLQQDFDLGETVLDLEKSIKQGLYVFSQEYGQTKAQAKRIAEDYQTLVEVSRSVDESEIAEFAPNITDIETAEDNKLKEKYE